MLKRWKVLAGATALLSIGVYAAAHGVTQDSTRAGVKTVCPRVSVEAEQPVAVIDADGSESTAESRLRSDYAQTIADVAEQAASQGSYLVISRFGSSIAGIETICETSTRVSAAAPLFADSRRTELERMLARASKKAGDVRVSEHGTDILAALIDALDRVHALRSDDHVPARIVILTDGEQVADGVSLRHLLKTGSDLATARRIVGSEELPSAPGIAIEIRGVGRVGVGGPVPTRTVLRMEHVWRLICASTHARSCAVSSNLTD
jgi:hypothetical protein